MNTLKIFWKRHKILFSFMSLLSVASIAAVITIPTLYFTNDNVKNNNNNVEEISELDLLDYWSVELPEVNAISDGIGLVVDSGLILNSWSENDPGSAASGLTNYVLNDAAWFTEGDTDDIAYKDTIVSPNATYWALDQAGFLYLWDNANSDIYGNKAPETPFDLNGDGIYNQYDTVKKAGGAMGTMWAISSSDILYMWGNNQYGQLGNGIDTKFTLDPHPVDINGDRVIDESDFVQDFEIDSYTSMALSSEGYLYTWGSDANGATGHDNFKINGVVAENKERMYYLTPQIVDLDGDGVTFSNTTNGDKDDKVISFGQDSSFTPYVSYDINYYSLGSGRQNKDISKFATTLWAISEDNYAYTWGANDVGQTGVSALYTPDSSATSASPESKNISPYYNEPQRLALGVYSDEYPAPGTQVKVQDMGISDGIGFALDEEGSVWLWGSSRFDITTAWQYTDNSSYKLQEKGTPSSPTYHQTYISQKNKVASYNAYTHALIPYEDSSSSTTLYDDISLSKAYNTPTDGYTQGYTVTPFKLDKDLFNDPTNGLTDNEFVEVGIGNYSNTAYLINNKGDAFMWGDFKDGQTGRYDTTDPMFDSANYADINTPGSVVSNSGGKVYRLNPVNFRDTSDTRDFDKDIVDINTGLTTSSLIDKEGYMYIVGEGNSYDYISGETKDAADFNHSSSGTTTVDANDKVLTSEIFFDDIQLTITVDNKLYQTSSVNTDGVNTMYWNIAETFSNGNWILS